MCWSSRPFTFRFHKSAAQAENVLSFVFLEFWEFAHMDYSCPNDVIALLIPHWAFTSTPPSIIRGVTVHPR